MCGRGGEAHGGGKGLFEKILNELIKGDYNEIEKEYVEKYSGT